MITDSEFVNYCLSFYGEAGVYKLQPAMTQSMAYHATAYRKESELWIDGDTLDREAVLNFCSAVYGIQWA